ncbi:hypothetical protein [Phenylobacterium parvum]|uniref:hypothetical protein n=1 Tax=Phenylobacterium parvum TaxID=2201350 RepID=UPI0013A5AA27|nr:hypothetical protein [Phenylobacterium parvum]
MQLERHTWRLENRLDALTGSLKPFEGKSLSAGDTFVVERIIIQMQIEWEHFVRALILDSATGRHSTRSGPVASTLPVKIRNREHAGHVLIAQYKKRTNEPDWYLPDDAIAAAGKLSLTNEKKIAAELGVTPWGLSDLRHLRNFISHRSGRSAINLRNATAVAKADPIIPTALCYEYALGGMRRYESWAGFMKGVAKRLVD